MEDKDLSEVHSIESFLELKLEPADDEETTWSPQPVRFKRPPAQPKCVNCQACKKTFNNVKTFNLHECSAQLQDNVYFCKLCNIVFNSLVPTSF